MWPGRQPAPSTAGRAVHVAGDAAQPLDDVEEPRLAADGQVEPRITVRIGGGALAGRSRRPRSCKKIAGEVYIDELNKGNGLFVAPVEWVLLDDQSKPELARSLYEKLITVDKVNLIIGPYAGRPASSPRSAARSATTRSSCTLRRHAAPREVRDALPDRGLQSSQKTVPTTVFDALAATSKPPEDGGDRHQQVPVRAVRQSSGAKEIAEKRGLKVASSTSSARVTGARSPRAYQGRQPGLPVDRRARPRRRPALGGDEEARLRRRVTSTCSRRRARWWPRPTASSRCRVERLEEHPPFMNNTGTAKLVPISRSARPRRTSLTTSVDMQVAGSLAAWQVLEAGVTATESLRRQGHRAVAPEEPRRHHHRQAALRRPEQLRRRPLQGEAGAGRQVGDRVAARVRGARRSPPPRPDRVARDAERHAARPGGRLRPPGGRYLRAARSRPEPSGIGLVGW